VTSPPSLFRTWLQLFRAPNLFTVPGDPLAGFLIANWGRTDHTLLLVVLASVCFYAAGLLQNDLADIEEDTRERPSRPLPSGSANPQSARRVMWALNAGGLALCAATLSGRVVIVGGSIIASVWLYNRVTKKLPVIGAINMGLCRSLSVMLGAFAGPLSMTQNNTWSLGLMPAILFGLYIAAVTNLARYETKTRVPVLARLLPAVAVLLAAFGGSNYARNSPGHVPAIGLFVLAVAAVAWTAIRGFRGTPLPPLIGAHIRILLILQAAICFLADPSAIGEMPTFGTMVALVLLAAWPVSSLVSRRFYAS
jgi:4-hydroxybenzoate polyprenyltransferase